MQNKSQSTGWGIAFMITGMFIVPGMDAIAKHLGQHLSPMQITWGRFLFQLLFMGAAIVLTLDVKALMPKRPLTHTLRGLLLAIATTFFFFSLLYLPLADAIAIFFIQPLLITGISPASLLAPFSYLEIVSATILGWLVFNEWPTLMTWVGIAVIVCSGLYMFLREQRQAPAGQD